MFNDRKGYREDKKVVLPDRLFGDGNGIFKFFSFNVTLSNDIKMMLLRLKGYILALIINYN